MIGLTRFELNLVRSLLNIRPVIEIGIAHSGIEQVATRLRSRLLWVVDSIPADMDGVLILELDAEIVGSQWSDDKRCAVLIVDIAQQCLIDRTGQRKSEVRILTIAHIRETLV